MCRLSIALATSLSGARGETMRTSEVIISRASKARPIAAVAWPLELGVVAFGGVCLLLVGFGFDGCVVALRRWAFGAMLLRRGLILVIVDYHRFGI